MRRILLWVAVILVLAAVGWLGLFSLAPRLAHGAGATQMYRVESKGREVRDQLLSRGVEETGSINLVSAIYLGYRAYDTLGETIVLVLSVAGVLAVTGGKR